MISTRTERVKNLGWLENENPTARRTESTRAREGGITHQRGEGMSPDG